MHIQSPRSKMVLEELGLEEKKLYKITQKEYISNHPELMQDSLDIQTKRYEHYEQRRQEAIDNARKIRSEIISKEKANGDNKNGKNNQDEENTKQSGMINTELEKLEQLKKQQLGEIKNLIDYEYSLNETRKKNEQREKEKKEKELRIEKEKLKRQRIKEMEMKEKEEER